MQTVPTIKPSLLTIERKKLKQSVESVFENYRLFTAISSGDPTPGVDRAAKINSYRETVETAVNKLHPKEQELIIARYMVDDYVLDKEVYANLDQPICESSYRAVRDWAMYKLALMLELDCGIDVDQHIKAFNRARSAEEPGTLWQL